MKFRHWLIFVVIVSFANNVFAETAPGNMQLFLLIGQSNMAGRGAVEPSDKATDPRIFMLTKEQQWVPAKDPVHFDKPVAGVGLCSEFARQMVAANPKIKVGLIPCAVGGTSLDQWKAGGSLYNNAIARAREAMKHGTLAGILWHQGESDCESGKVATYGERFAAMIGQLRKDLQAENVPVIMGELGQFKPSGKAFNAALPEVIRRVPLCALATSEDLTDKGDKTHFDSPSLRIFGKRYAEAFLKLKAQAPAKK